MKILLGVDTSPHASETISYLCGAQWAAGSSVIVLSVVGPNEPETIPTPVVLASVAQDIEAIEAYRVREHEEVVARAERVLRDAGFTATSEIAYGDPRHLLVETARSHAVDLIVVGHRGHTALRRLVMGSVASYVTAHAPCCVMVVRPVHHEAEAPPSHERNAVVGA